MAALLEPSTPVSTVHTKSVTAFCRYPVVLEGAEIVIASWLERPAPHPTPFKRAGWHNYSRSREPARPTCRTRLAQVQKICNRAGPGRLEPRVLSEGCRSASRLWRCMRLKLLTSVSVSLTHHLSFVVCHPCSLFKKNRPSQARSKVNNEAARSKCQEIVCRWRESHSRWSVIAQHRPSSFSS